MSSKKCVIFDWDGTISDSLKFIENSLKSGYTKADVEISYNDQRRMIGLPLLEIAYKLPENKQQLFLDGFRGYQQTAGISQVTPIAGIIKLISTLKSSNIPIGIVSSRFRSSLNDYLRNFRLSDVFDVIITPEEFPIRKPNPEPLLEAINILNCFPDNSIFIGDSIHDYETAIRANVLFIGVLWGAGTQSDLTSAYRIVDSVAELCSELETFLDHSLSI